MMDSKLTWNPEDTVRFIHLYRGEEPIWNPQNTQHKDRNKVSDAWMRISEEMGIAVPDLKKRKECLMTTFRLLRKKKLESIRCGLEAEEAYEPAWPYYKELEAFLHPVYMAKSEFNSEQASTSSAAHIVADVLYDSDIETSVSQTSIHKRKRRAVDTTEAHYATATSSLSEILADKGIMVRDDCTNYCDLLASKLRLIPFDDRLDLMMEVDAVVYRYIKKARASPKIKWRRLH